MTEFSVCATSFFIMAPIVYFFTFSQKKKKKKTVDATSKNVNFHKKPLNCSSPVDLALTTCKLLKLFV